MDILYGRAAASVKRFSRFKWVTAAVLLAFLLLAWFFSDANRATPPATGVTVPGADAGSPSSGTASSPAAGNSGAPPAFAIDLAGDGSLKVRGMVADEVTRNQWLNAIRIGAQGARVTDELRIGAVSPAAGWIGQLGSLVAVMRESKVAGLSVDGDKVVLKGAVRNQADKADVERMVQAQLPAGYRLDSQLAVGVPAGGSTGASASSAPLPSAPSEAASPSPSSSASPPGTAPGGSRLDSAGAGAPQADGDSASRAAASGQDGQQPSKTAAARKPANCPRQVRSLAKSVYFKTDAATIAPKDRARLERMGECLGMARVRIVGHADPRHTDEYNLELSERRARAVADALAAGGASSSRITVVAAGKTRPTAKGASRQALQRSRRVDIQVR